MMYMPAMMGTRTDETQLILSVPPKKRIREITHKMMPTPKGIMLFSKSGT